MTMPKDPDKYKLTIKKMSEAQKGNKNSLGRKLSEETKKKIGEGQKGKISGNKGKLKNGGTFSYWAREMKKIYRECILCKSSGPLHMHHMDGDNTNNDRSNRVILCITCHEFWHHN